MARVRAYVLMLRWVINDSVRKRADADSFSMLHTVRNGDTRGIGFSSLALVKREMMNPHVSVVDVKKQNLRNTRLRRTVTWPHVS